MAKPKLMPKVSSLRDLRERAKTDDRYRRLAIVGAGNLGFSVGDCWGNPTDAQFEKAMRFLSMNADETTERGVVGEVNFVRDCVVTNVDSPLENN